MERARARVTAALYRRSRVAFEGAAKKRRAPSEPVPRRGRRAQQARPGLRPAARRAAGGAHAHASARRGPRARPPSARAPVHRPRRHAGRRLLLRADLGAPRHAASSPRAAHAPRSPDALAAPFAARCQGPARRAPRQRKRYGCRPACGRSARGAQRERWLPRRGGSGGASCGARGRCGAARRAASPAAPAAQPQPAAAAQPAACAGAAASAACARRLCV